MAGFLFLNFVACRQSRGLVRFAPSDQPPRRQGWQADLLGVEIPRPVNKRNPRDVGLRFETRTFPGAQGERVEAWIIPSDASPHGTVIAFHGHAGSKESLLSVAARFHEWGWETWLVDFYGSGGSSGNETSIGWHEAEDVKAAFDQVARGSTGKPVVLFGASMGAAAILRSVAVHELKPEGLILECPFDRLRTTVASRFRREGFPTFPMLDLILCWGGIQSGFNPYRHNPVEFAATVRCPALLMQGDKDVTISLEESRSIARALGARCAFRVFEGRGHEALQAGNPALWDREVLGFLRAF